MSKYTSPVSSVAGERGKEKRKRQDEFTAKNAKNRQWDADRTQILVIKELKDLRFGFC
jgi:hypothetical protein